MKNFIMKIILHFLYRGIKVLNGRDSEITKEISNLPNGYTITLETDTQNPIKLSLIVQNGKVKKIKNLKTSDLKIVFKHKDLAFKTLLGQIGIANAFAQHYFGLYGNIYTAMAVTRILERVEGYLFPKFINKKCLKKPFKRQISMFKTYLLCIF